MEGMRPAPEPEVRSSRSRRAEPRYILLADELTRRIQAGVYPVGSCLPAEHQLCEQFDVSRFTVRQALSRLRDNGLVSPEHGVGTRVESAAGNSRYLLSLGSVSDISELARSTRMQILRQGFIKPGEAGLKLPHVHPEGPWLLVEGLRFLHGQALPIGLTHIHVSPRFAGIAPRIDKRAGPIFALVEEMYGERVAAIRQEITAIAVPARMIKLLRVKRGAPVLRIIRHYLTAANLTIEVSSHVSVSERFVYSADIVTR